MGVKNLGFIQSILVSTTAPTNLNILWYDDNPGQKLHKAYYLSSASWEPLGGGTGPEITVADIPARDLLSGLAAGQKVFVTDATNGGGGLTPKDDPGNGTVDFGWAMYRWDGSSLFLKIAEQESMDVTASTVGFTPDVPANWDPVPTKVKGALDQLAAKSSTTVGRVIYVSAAVAIDKVGVIGDLHQPYGLEAGGLAQDLPYDLVYVFPGTYNVTKRLDVNATTTVNYYFCQGAIVNYTPTISAESMLASIITKNILGYGEFHVKGDGLIFGHRMRILEFDSIYLDAGSSVAIYYSDATSHCHMSGKLISINAAATWLPVHISGNAEIDQIRINNGGYVEIGRADKSIINIGSVISTGRGLYILNSGYSDIIVNVGYIESVTEAIGSVSQASGRNIVFNVSNIKFTGTGTALGVCGDGCIYNISYLEHTGASGQAIVLYVGSGVLTYNIQRIYCSGGAYGIFGEANQTVKNIYNIGTIDVIGAQAIRMSLRGDNIVDFFPTIFNIKLVRANGYPALFIYTTATATSTNTIVFKDCVFESDQETITFQLHVGFQDLHDITFDNCRVISGGTYCINSDEVETELRFINTYSNKPLAPNILPLFDGVIVSDKIKFT